MQVATSPVAKRLPSKKAPIKGLLAYGNDNLFPQNLLNVLSDSVTAGACLSIKAEFIEGNGFKDTVLSKMVMHPESGMTLDKVLNRMAWNVAYFETICLHVRYNGLGEIASVRPMPVEHIRYCVPDEFGMITKAAILPYLDSDYYKSKKNKFVECHLFNPDPEVVLQQIEEAGGLANYKGQLIYEPFWIPGDGFYHQPSYFNAIRAIESEGQLDLYDWRTITSGFNVSGIFSILGKPMKDGQLYNPMGDPNSIEYQLSEHQGADNAASLLVLRTENVEELKSIRFDDTTGANLADRYNSTNDRVQSKITRAMRVPNELVNIRRQGGIAPTGDEIKVSSQLMQQSVNRIQRRISEIIAVILQHWKEPVEFPVNAEEEPCQIENLNYFPEDKNAPKEAKPTVTENVG